MSKVGWTGLDYLGRCGEKGLVITIIEIMLWPENALDSAVNIW